MIGRRRRRSVRPQQAIEPAIAQLEVPVLDESAAVRNDLGELPERYALLVLATEHGVLDSGEFGAYHLGRTADVEPLLVHRRRRVGVDLAQLLPVRVLVEDREFRVGVAQRHALAAEVDANGQQLVLDLVLHVDEVACEQAPFTALAQAVEALPLRLLGRRDLGRPEHFQLLPREEMRVLRDDCGRFGALLLAHADGAALFGALERVSAEGPLVVVRSGNRARCHGAESTCRYDRRWP